MRLARRGDAGLDGDQTPTSRSRRCRPRRRPAGAGRRRILEDERLRGDLTDDEFQPLLGLGADRADRIAASTAGHGRRRGRPASSTRRLMTSARSSQPPGPWSRRTPRATAERRSAERQSLPWWSRQPTDAVAGVPDEAVAGRLRTLAERLDADPDVPGPESPPRS